MAFNENQSQKIKICFVVNECNFFYSHRFELARKLTSIAEVFLLTDVSTTNKKLLNKIVDADINIRPLQRRTSKKGLIGFFSYFINLFDLINKIKPTAIFFVTLEISLIGSLISFFKKRIYFYYLVTGFGPFLFEQNFKNKFLFYIHKFIFISRKRMDNIKFIFQNTKDKDTFIDLGFTDEKSAVLIHGSGIDLTAYTFKKRDFDKPLSFLFASRLVKAKGIREYLEASQIIKETYPEISIYIAGKYDPKDPDRISKELFHNIQNSDFVEYLGNVPHDKIYETYMNSDIFVLPSYGEGLPKAALEAAASGMPLILSNVSGCKECLEYKKNGLFIKTQDVESMKTAMVWMILNQQQASKMSVASRDLIERKFSINKIYHSYVDLIREIK